MEMIFLRKYSVFLVVFVFLSVSILPVFAQDLNKYDFNNRSLDLDNNIITNDEIKTKKIHLEFSIPQVKSEGEYSKIIVKEIDTYSLISGEPSLPKYNTLITLPFGSEIVNVKCTFSSFETIYLSKKIEPVNYPILNGINNIFTNYKTNLDIYNNIDWYPSEMYVYHTGGGLNNNNHVTFLSIQLYPVRYSPKNDIIEYTKKIDIEIFYKEPISPLFINDDYDLLIISPSEYLSYLTPFIDHKNSYGILTKFVSLEEIEGIGRDKQEQIKYFIKDAIEQWGIKYVLLVGSIDKLPIRQTWIGEFDVLTDLYYADIYFPNMSFSSWDTNGNGRYGEYWQVDDDVVDLYPDVYIGRLACKNKYEIRNVVNKIIKYETSTYGKEWFNNIILCAGDTHPGWGVYEGEVTVNEIIKVMPEFTPIKLFTSDGTFSARSLNKALNNGAGFLAYSGHGFEIGISTHPPNSEKWIGYYFFNLFLAFNVNKLPIIFFDACLTSRLDYNLGDLIKLPFIHFPLSCFAWCFVKKQLGGAIATIGATRVAFSRVTEEGPVDGSGYLSLLFFKNYKQSANVAQMFVSSQNDYLNNVSYDPMTIEEFILLGDPSLVVGGYNE